MKLQVTYSDWSPTGKETRRVTIEGQRVDGIGMFVSDFVRPLLAAMGYYKENIDEYINE